MLDILFYRNLSKFIEIYRHLSKICNNLSNLPVVLWQGHERATHDDKLDLVDTVAELLELINTMLGLEIWIVPGTDGPHGGRLVSRVRLG
jgi:hypothetical protein